MISGTSNEPINIESHLGAMGKKEDKTEMRHLLISSGVLTDSGSFNIELARENLGKKFKYN